MNNVFHMLSIKKHSKVRANAPKQKNQRTGLENSRTEHEAGRWSGRGDRWEGILRQ